MMMTTMWMAASRNLITLNWKCSTWACQYSELHHCCDIIIVIIMIILIIIVIIMMIMVIPLIYSFFFYQFALRLNFTRLKFLYAIYSSTFFENIQLVVLKYTMQFVLYLKQVCKYLLYCLKLMQLFKSRVVKTLLWGLSIGPEKFICAGNCTKWHRTGNVPKSHRTNKSLSHCNNLYWTSEQTELHSKLYKTLWICNNLNCTAVHCHQNNCHL